MAVSALFYSISNAQRGLAGISFGNFLIKRVVSQLMSELDNLKTFSTLSPIPGFRRWLDNEIGEGKPKILLPNERKVLKAVAEKGKGSKGLLKELMNEANWHHDDAISDALKAPLMRLCAKYLAEEKRGDRALDPVANFHLSNGASVERINWLGDTAPKGFDQSAGMMVNYLYRLSKIEENHEDYHSKGVVNASSGVRGLIKG